jgi:mannan endo-1,4-beta-mannosidase
MKSPSKIWFLALFMFCLVQFAFAQPLLSPRPIKSAVSLKKFLDSIYGKKILSGQCDDKYLPFIKEVSGGKEPAIMGYDFNGICPSQSGNHDVEKAIAWHKRGGIVTFQWHWISPDANGDFYTDKFDLSSALSNPNSESYQHILRDLDLVARDLKRLESAGVPVIWRPLHEAEGKWFWWGKSGADSCKKLYQLMFDRFTGTHHLRNLIWTWTSYGSKKGNWYPGKDKVDVIVWDYEEPDSWSDLTTIFGGDKKLFALGEEGKLPDPTSFEKSPWLYFLTWAYMIQDEKKGNSKDWIKRVYNDPRVLTLSDLTRLRAVGKGM